MEATEKGALSQSSLGVSYKVPEQVNASNVDTLASSLYGQQASIRIIPQGVIEDAVESGRAVVGVTDHANTVMSKLKDANDSLINNNIELLMANDKYQKTLDETQTNYQNERDALLAQREQDNATNTQLEEMNKKLSEENVKKDGEINRLNKALYNKEEELKVQQTNGVSRRTMDLEDELRAKEQENSDLKNEISMKSQLYEMQKKELQDKAKDFETTKKYLESVIEDLRFELDNKQLSNDTNQKYNEEVNNRQRSELDELKMKVTFLRKTIDEKEERNENLKSTIQDYSEKIDELNDTIAMRDAELAAMNKRINAMRKEARDGNGFVSNVTGPVITDNSEEDAAGKKRDELDSSNPPVKYEQTQRELELQNEVIEKTKIINDLNERILELETIIKNNSRKNDNYQKDDFDTKDIDNFITEEQNNRLQRALEETEQTLRKKVEDQNKFLEQVLKENDETLRDLHIKYNDMESSYRQRLIEKDEKISQLYKINKENEVAYNNKINEFVSRISNLEKENELLAKQNKIATDNLAIYKKLKEKAEQESTEQPTSINNSAVNNSAVPVPMRSQVAQETGASMYGRPEIVSSNIAETMRDREGNNETLVPFLKSQNTFLTNKNKELEAENKELTTERFEIETELKNLKLEHSNLQIVNNNNLNKIKELNASLSNKKRKTLAAKNELKDAQQSVLALQDQLKLMKQKVNDERRAREQASSMRMSIDPRRSQMSGINEGANNLTNVESNLYNPSYSARPDLSGRIEEDPRIGELENENKRLKVKISSLESDNRASKAKVDQIRTEMDEKNRNFEEVAAKYTENLKIRNRALDELREKNIQLQNENEELNKEIERYTNEMKELKAHDNSNEKEATIKQFMNNYSEAKRENMKLKQDLSSANERVNELAKEIAAHKEDIANLEEKNKILSRDHEEYKQKAKESIDKLKNALINSGSRTGASMAGSSFNGSTTAAPGASGFGADAGLSIFNQDPDNMERQQQQEVEDPNTVRVTREYLNDCEKIFGEYDILAGQLEEYKNANQSLEETIKKQNAIIITLQNDVHQNHSNDLEYISKNNETMIGLNETIAELEKRIRDVSEENDAREKTIVEKNGIIENQTRDIEELTATKEQLVKDLASAKEESSMLNDVLKANKEATENMKASFDAKLSEMQSENDKVRRLLKQEIEQRNQERADLQNEINNLKQECESQKQEIDSLNNDVTNLMSVVRNRDEEIMKLKNNLDGYHKIRTMLNDMLACANGRIEETEQRNAILIESESQLKADNIVLRNQIDELGRLNTEMQDSTCQVLSERARKQQEVEEEMRRVNEHFSNGREIVKERVATIAREISIMKALKTQNPESEMATVMQLQAECETLHQSLDDVSALAASLEEQNTILNERIAECSRIIDDSRLQLIRGKVDAQHSLEQAQIEAIKYKEQLEAQKKEYDERIEVLTNQLNDTIRKNTYGGNTDMSTAVDEKMKRDLDALKDFKSVVKAQNEQMIATGNGDNIVVPSMGYIAQMAINRGDETPN